MRLRERRLPLLGVALTLTTAFAGCGDGGDSGRGGSPTALAVGCRGKCDSWAAAWSSDGGHTWSSPSDLPGAAWGVALVGRREAWAVGDESIVHTSDGGKAWEDQAAHIDAPGAGIALLEVAFATTDRGVAVGAEPVDPATVPTALPTPHATPPPQTDFDFPTPTFTPPPSPPGSGPPLVLITTNGGARWSRATILPGDDPAPFENARLTSVCLTPEGFGLATGSSTRFPPRRGFILRTRDGGSTWENLVDRTPHGGGGAAVACAGASDGWVTGTSLNAMEPCFFCTAPFVIHTADAGTTWEDQSGNVDRSVSTMGGFLAISVLDGSIGFAGGERGIGGQGFPGAGFRRTADGGRHWTDDVTLDVADDCQILHLAFADASHGVAMCQTRGIADTLVTDDGGGTWARVPISGLDVSDVAITRTGGEGAR
ncbi:MAG TPA: hypothetical protein VGK30_19725 [Candidatus Binatia bacterium]|jgi:photosystem II stability/assembly factor-like uncharacterized protein